METFDSQSQKIAVAGEVTFPVLEARYVRPIDSDRCVYENDCEVQEIIELDVDQENEDTIQNRLEWCKSEYMPVIMILAGISFLAIIIVTGTHFDIYTR